MPARKNKSTRGTAGAHKAAAVRRAKSKRGASAAQRSSRPESSSRPRAIAARKAAGVHHHGSRRRRGNLSPRRESRTAARSRGAAQLLAKKPPKTYRYDSSLDPALAWDENDGRERAEWLIGLIERAATEGEATVFASPQSWAGGGVTVESLKSAARMLRRLSSPYLDWAGKAERHQIEVPTVPLFVHERHSTKAILDGVKHRVARGTTLAADSEALWEVEVRGLDTFNPAEMKTESVEAANLPCWMLDTDYNGLAFYAAQVFFPKTAAWDNLKRALGASLDESVWDHLAGTVSEPFVAGGYKRIAVKVIDERGNELMVVKAIGQ